MAGSWRLDIATLTRFWTDVYPKIVGHAWLDDEFRDRFRADETIRRAEFAAKGISLDSGMEISLRGPGQKNFFLSVRGIHLPWPDPPSTLDELLAFYEQYFPSEPPPAFPGLPNIGAFAVFVGPVDEGPVVPQFNPDTLSAFIDKFEPDIAGNVALADGDAFAVVDAILHGKALQDILMMVPRVIASAWGGSEEEQRYLTDTKDALGDISIPASLDMVVDQGTTQYFIESDGQSTWTFHLPYPNRPNLETVFRMYASGDADNPVWTGTV